MRMTLEVASHPIEQGLAIRIPISLHKYKSM